jgi:hypothetical protein
MGEDGAGVYAVDAADEIKDHDDEYLICHDCRLETTTGHLGCRIEARKSQIRRAHDDVRHEFQLRYPNPKQLLPNLTTPMLKIITWMELMPLEMASQDKEKSKLSYKISSLRREIENESKNQRQK